MGGYFTFLVLFLCSFTAYGGEGGSYSSTVTYGYQTQQTTKQTTQQPSTGKVTSGTNAAVSTATSGSGSGGGSVSGTGHSASGQQHGQCGNSGQNLGISQIVLLLCFIIITFC
ncbi:uncharacterized protein LOC123541755 [Mercenaria mercenaria]|uniref:uncharacterized protein LOC123541755 n=1 Tax=Mercenaria mercenaria TaxID=6596 RepID=UPI00234EE879|nr:uncharacterized protein LOC123541755 [Mercenaria mercenaria]